MARTVTDKNKGENRIVQYLRDTWFELKKVSWPTRKEAINLTIIVVAVTSFLAIVLGLMDWLFSALVGGFLNLVA
ncbi:MAG: preprotein translocase subunit SecE [Anaerolineae bacterium]|nr:preprotein translocase subunit SecE [Anaerolineae bacterium]